MIGRANGLLSGLWWFFAAAAIFFIALSGFAVWRYTSAHATNTPVADVTSFKTPNSTDRPTLYLMLPTGLANTLPAGEPHCTSSAGQHWFAAVLGGPTVDEGGTAYSSVLQLPNGWQPNDRITCTGVSGPALLSAQQSRSALIMAGVGAVAALLAAGFAIVGFVSRPARNDRPGDGFAQPWGGR